MKHRLYGLRGTEFVKERDRFFEQIKDDSAKDFNQLVESNKSESFPDGKFTPRNLGELCNKYRLWPKTLNEFLAQLNLLRSGTWEKLKERGATAKSLGVNWNYH